MGNTGRNLDPHTLILLELNLFLPTHLILDYKFYITRKTDMLCCGEVAVVPAHRARSHSSHVNVQHLTPPEHPGSERLEYYPAVVLMPREPFYFDPSHYNHSLK